VNIARAYALMLRLYPADYRAFFQPEMETALQHAAADQRACGWFRFVRLAVGELLGLAIGAGADWMAKLTADRFARGRCLPDVRMMRPPGITRDEWLRNI
jgi:hypothetical protein